MSSEEDEVLMGCSFRLAVAYLSNARHSRRVNNMFHNFFKR